jgi:three-Cys-motif partner protein
LTHIPYRWTSNGPLPTIKPHSIAKHNVIHAYLVDYIQTLVSSPHQEELRLTLVDGFAGGGLYKHEITKEIVFGSPFRLLNAVKEAEAVINQHRQNPLRMNVDYFFVDAESDACSFLNKTLQDQGYSGRIGADIKVLNGRFELEATRIRDFIRTKNPRNGRSIFLLDQYGYKDVPTPLIRLILKELPAAEVILTFNVDSFINFASDTPLTTNLLQQIGIPDVLRGRSIEDIKKNEKDFRVYIQSCLYRELVEACGARFYTPFFIRTEGHGDYWLVHLSQHPRARDVMARVHWANNNNFIHYGGAGIEMFQALGYSPKQDDSITGQSKLGFCFDDPAAQASVTTLMEQLPDIIYANQGGISFGEIFAMTCNSSPADSAKYKEALSQLVQQKDIDIVSPDGKRRLKASTITDKDQLIPSRQTSFKYQIE